LGKIRLYTLNICTSTTVEKCLRISALVLDKCMNYILMYSRHVPAFLSLHGKVNNKWGNVWASRCKDAYSSHIRTLYVIRAELPTSRDQWCASHIEREGEREREREGEREGERERERDRERERE
jgi:hypothetical protein